MLSYPAHGINELKRLEVSSFPDRKRKTLKAILAEYSVNFAFGASCHTSNSFRVAC
jgi:hypothetical protein